MPDNIHKKGAFEKMTLEGRPPLSLGVTSGGNLYGGTAVTFGDVLGDKLINFDIESVSTYRTYSFTYTNIGRRFQYALQGFSTTEFFYGENTQAALFYDPSLAPFISTSDAQAVYSSRGGLVYGIYPLSRYTRLELTAGLVHTSQNYTDPSVQQAAAQYQLQTYGTLLFANGNEVPMGAAFIQETTVFREFGPLAGRTMRLAYTGAPGFSNFLEKQTLDGDARRYMRIGTTGLLAVRLRAFDSWGQFPDFTYFGGNSELSGYDYLSFTGQKAFFADAELRFPLVEAMKTPLGILGGIRGKFFFDLGAAGLAGQSFKPFAFKAETTTPIVGYNTDASGNLTPITGPPTTISGFRLEDARASYGLGLETFVLGFPAHFDWAWRTLFNQAWEDSVYALEGGSAWLRKVTFHFWIGYDF